MAALSNATLTLTHLQNVLDTSNSVASIINAGGPAPAPLGDIPLITNRTGFIAANSAQASTPYNVLNVYWTCDVITFRFLIDWQPQPVVGISILELVPAKNSFGYKIKQVCWT